MGALIDESKKPWEKKKQGYYCHYDKILFRV